MCLHYIGMCCTGRFLHQRAGAAPRLVYTQGPELHLDLARLQQPVMILDVSTLQGRELHLDIFRLQYF
jgi:hypothetical protein